MPRVGLLVDTVKDYYFSYITWDSKRVAELMTESVAESSILLRV